MKKLSVLLVFALLFGLITGCNDNSDFSENSQDTSRITEESVNELKNESSTEVFEKVNGYIDFEIKSTKFGFSHDFVDGMIALIRSSEELLSFTGNPEKGSFEEYNEEYFKEKSLILIPFIRGSGSIDLDVKHIFVNEESLIVTVTEFNPEVQTDDMQYKLISAEVNKSDVVNVNDIKLVLESQYSYSYYSEDEPIEKGDFTQHHFEERIKEDEFKTGSGRGAVGFNRLDIIKDSFELSMFTEKYESGEGESLLGFARTLDDKFFEETVLIGISYYGRYNNTVVEISGVEVKENKVNLGIFVSEENSTEYEDFEGTFLIEIPRKLINEATEFYAVYEYVEFDYAANEHDIDFEYQTFRGCHHGPHENVVNDTYIPVRLMLSQKGMDNYLEDICDRCPTEDAFFEYVESLDEEFFKEYAVLISIVWVDKGEKVELGNVYAHNHLGFGVLRMDIAVNDSVKPSKDEDLESYLIVAIIDKNETIGYDWLDGNLVIR